MKDHHFLVLGSQKLTELRDEILCPNDYFCTEELSEDPSVFSNSKPLQGPTNVSTSAFFFIGESFYDDLRHPKATDTSRYEYCKVLNNFF